jgi:hypothetical protein
MMSQIEPSSRRTGPGEEPGEPGGAGLKSSLPWSFIFGATWFVCFALFPSWLLPVSVQQRFAVLVVYIIYFGFHTYLVRRWLDADPATGLPVSGDPAILSFLRRDPMLVLVLAAAAVLEIYPMTMPLLTRMDEATHVQYAVGILRRADAAALRALGVSLSNIVRVVVVLLVAGIILLKAAGRQVTDVLKALMFTGWKKALAWLVLLLVFMAGFYALRGLEFHVGIIRFPPIAKIIYIIEGALFGLREPGFRLAQWAFYLLTAVFLYRTMLLYRGRHAALLAASVYLFSPAVFYFGNLAELSSGIGFFIVVSAFYLLRFIKERNEYDAVAAFYFASTGFLYKREILLLFLVLWIFLALEPRRSLFRRKLFYAKVSWIGLAPVVMWLAVGRAFPAATMYLANFRNWTSPDTALSYMDLLLRQMGYAGFIVFAISLVYLFARARDILCRYWAVYFLLFFVFYTTLDYREAVPRYSMVFYPVVAVAIGDYFSYLASRTRRVKAFAIASACIVVYFALAATVVQFRPMDDRYVAYKDTKSRYVPYDTAVEWIGENIPRGSRILVTMAVNPLPFYRDKYGVEMDWIGDIWTEPEMQTADNLYEFCVENGIHYVLFPRGKWLRLVVNEDMVDDLAAGLDPRFKILRRFDYGANQLYVWTVREPAPPVGN